MRQTLFFIPPQLFGVDVFGFGWLLLLWGIGGTGFLVWSVSRDGWTAETRGYLPWALIGAVVIAAVPSFVNLNGPGIPIRGFGMLVLVGIVSAVWLAAYRAGRMGLDPEYIHSLAIWLFLGGFGGARLFYVAQYWEQFVGKPTLWETVFGMVNIAEGGIVVYGAVIGAGAALVLFASKHALPLLALGDLIAPSLAIGLTFGRLGCFLNGCCYGGPSEVSWAVRFPAGSPAHMRQVNRGKLSLYGMTLAEDVQGRPVIATVIPGSLADRQELEPGDRITSIDGIELGGQHAIGGHAISGAQYARHLLLTQRTGRFLALATRDHPDKRLWDLSSEGSLPVHPTQLYSSINAALLFLFLLAYYPFRRRDGEVIALMFTIYPVSRFLLEWIRVDEGAVGATALTISQIVSLVTLAVVTLLWIYLLRQPAGSALPAAPLLKPTAIAK